MRAALWRPRTASIGIEGLAFALAHETGHHVGGPPYHPCYRAKGTDTELVAPTISTKAATLENRIELLFFMQRHTDQSLPQAILTCINTIMRSENEIIGALLVIVQRDPRF